MIKAYYKRLLTCVHFVFGALTTCRVTESGPYRKYMAAVDYPLPHITLSIIAHLLNSPLLEFFLFIVPFLVILVREGLIPIFYAATGFIAILVPLVVCVLRKLIPTFRSHEPTRWYFLKRNTVEHTGRSTQLIPIAAKF